MEPPIVVNPEEEPLETFRNILQYAYPAVLLLAFIVVGSTDSIITALRKNDFVVPTVTGPGGKPLPITKRKREDQDDEDNENQSSACKSLFRCCMMLATFTFFCAGANVAVRALYNRTASGGHGWWCGEPKTVSLNCWYPNPPSRVNWLTFAGLHPRFRISISLCDRHTL